MCLVAVCTSAPARCPALSILTLDGESGPVSFPAPTPATEPAPNRICAGAEVPVVRLDVLTESLSPAGTQEHVWLVSASGHKLSAPPARKCPLSARTRTGGRSSRRSAGWGCTRCTGQPRANTRGLRLCLLLRTHLLSDLTRGKKTKSKEAK